MSEFKPMVKMYTDEPSVSLKLKKGGKVKAKHHKEHSEHGHKAMQHHAMGGMHKAFESEAGKAPKKPSMMARVKAMNPQMYKKGGKVAHKALGGAMPGAMPGAMGAPAGGMKPMGQAALGQMTPQQRMARAMMVKKALGGMKKGGSADHKMIEKLEKELHHHEALDMAHAHHKKHGGMAHHAHGGKVHKTSGHPEGSHEHHKAMCKHYEKMCKADGGSAHAKRMLAHHKKMCMGGSYASGGEIDRDETKTTIEGNAKRFVNNIHDGEHHDHTSGKTGDVKLGKAAGYKHGGHAHKKHHFAEGGSTGNTIPSDSKKSMNSGKISLGGTIEGNEHYYEDTDMHTADKFSGSKATGGVRMSNAGGFKHGGKAHHKMHHKADGGAIDKYETRDTVEGGNWENRPADTTPKGKTNTKTGDVKLANGGGYKHGGHASKKAYATGGNVNAMGKPVAMPKHFVSQPVANSLQSGTFKKGGEVHHHADGGQEKPNLRLIKTHTGPKGHVAKVYKDRDWGEHRVKFFNPEGKHLTEGDYHTDDAEDAHDTAMSQVHKGYAKGGKAALLGGLGKKIMSDMPKMMGPLEGKPPKGSVTKTITSVTMSPVKKRRG